MSFQFQLVITERCNLKCDYCYMTKRFQDMSKEIFDLHYESLPILMKTYKESNYVAAYFGGEPLMNWDLIEYSAPIFKNDEKCVGSFIATNGLALGPERQEFLKRNNVRLSISFDGLWNDVNRKLADGKESLKYYINLKNIIRLKSCKVMVSPQRGNITLRDNYLWFLNDYNIPSPDFTLVRDDIWTDDDILKFDNEIKDLTKENIKVILSGKQSLVGWYALSFLDTYVYQKQGKRKFSCFAGHHGLGFMPNGGVYPCARFGSDNKNIIWSSVNKTFFNKFNFFNPKIVNPIEYDECKSCELYNICNSGCVYSQLEYGKKLGKDICVPIPNVCKLFKIIYRETRILIDEVGKTETFKKIVKNLIRSV